MPYSVPYSMDAPEDNFTENNVAGEIENSENQKQEAEETVIAGAAEKRWPGWPGESVFRILVPAHKVGGIIGRKGESIKKMCEESKARIKILDGPPGSPERVVLSAVIRQQMPNLQMYRRTMIQFARFHLRASLLQYLI